MRGVLVVTGTVIGAAIVLTWDMYHVVRNYTKGMFYE